MHGNLYVVPKISRLWAVSRRHIEPCRSTDQILDGPNNVMRVGNNLLEAGARRKEKSFFVRLAGCWDLFSCVSLSKYEPK